MVHVFITIAHRSHCAIWPLKVKVKLLSRVRLFATPWTVAYQPPSSTGYSRQESWSGLPFPSPGDLPDPGIEPRSPALQADALPSEPPGKHFGHWTTSKSSLSPSSPLPSVATAPCICTSTAVLHTCRPSSWLWGIPAQPSVGFPDWGGGTSRTS